MRIAEWTIRRAVVVLVSSSFSAPAMSSPAFVVPLSRFTVIVASYCVSSSLTPGTPAFMDLSISFTFYDRLDMATVTDVTPSQLSLTLSTISSASSSRRNSAVYSS